MRYAINTFQSGGEQTPFYQPLDPSLTPPPVPVQQASPVQAPPGAAGPTPTAAPPSDAGPPAAPQRPTVPFGQALPLTPAQAIDTSGTTQADPLFNPDTDLDKENDLEGRAFSPDNIASHKGDHRFLTFDVQDKAVTHDNVMRRAQESQDWPKYERALELFEIMGHPKGQQAKLDKMLNRIYTTTRSQMVSERNDALRKERDAVKQEDDKPLPPNIAANLDQQIAMELTKYDQRTYAAAKGPDPKEAQLAAERRAASPFGDPDAPADKNAGYLRGTLRDDQINRVVRNLITLNRNSLGVPDAVDLAIHIATPVQQEKKGYNGLGGRAGAAYVPYAVDPAGNYQIRTAMGTFRIDPDVYKMVKDARAQGYDAGRNYRAKIQQKRVDERQPGPVQRTINWFGRQLE